MIVYQDTKLTIFQSTLYQTNSILYNAEDFVLLADPNWLPQEVEFIRSYVAEHYEDKPIYLLFTHSDYDHILGYGAFPGAKVIASEAFQNNISKADIIKEIHFFDQKHYLQRDYPITYPEVDFIISENGQQLEIAGERFTFYLSPGHTNDGLFTIIDQPGTFLAGDYLSNLEFPFIYYNSYVYQDTLRQVDYILQNHIINLLIPGHGAFIKDANQNILRRKEEDMQYIEALRNSILDKSVFPLADWLAKFPFPDGLREQHEKNRQYMVKELNQINA